jgi:hypothetical protein
MTNPASEPDATSLTPSALRRSLAQRVAAAHDTLHPRPVCAMLLGSTVDGIADALSDLDMSIVFEHLPGAADLGAACQRAGGTRGARYWNATSAKLLSLRLCS